MRILKHLSALSAVALRAMADKSAALALLSAASVLANVNRQRWHSGVRL